MPYHLRTPYGNYKYVHSRCICDLYDQLSSTYGQFLYLPRVLLDCLLVLINPRVLLDFDRVVSHDFFSHFELCSVRKKLMEETIYGYFRYIVFTLLSLSCPLYQTALDRKRRECIVRSTNSNHKLERTSNVRACIDSRPRLGVGRFIWFELMV